MKIGRESAGILAAIAFGIAAALSVFVPTPNVTSPQATLADGRTISVMALTVGSNHVYASESGIKRLMRKILPTSLSGKLGPAGIRVQRNTESANLVVWLEVPPEPPAKAGKYRPVFGRFRVRASSGETFDSYSLLRSEALADRHLVPVSVQVYPRRDPAFTLLGELDGNPFQLRLSNPEPFKQTASLRPASLPTTNTTSGVSVVLRSGSITRYDWGEGPRMDFEFWQDGRNRSTEFGRWWTVSDLTGNRDWRVPTNEPVWLVDASFYRVVPARWPANRVHEFAISNALAPETHMASRPNLALGPTEIRDVWLGGSGTFTWDDKEIVSVTAPPPDGQNKPYHGTTSPDGKPRLVWARAEPWAMVGTSKFDTKRYHLSIFLIDSEGSLSAGKYFTRIGWGGFDATVFSFPDLKDGSKQLRPPISAQIVLQDLESVRFVINPAKLPRHLHERQVE